MKRFRPGVSFGDFVISDSSSKRSLVRDDLQRDFRKGWLVWLLILIAFGVLLVRLLALQIFYGDRYRVLSDQNRIKRIEIVAPRGVIKDRKGMILAGNKQNEDGKFEREYPFGPATVHALGYVGLTKDSEVGLLKDSGGEYSPDELIGRSGLESMYEDRLRGVAGGRLVEVDNLGSVARELGSSNSVRGEDLQTSLDGELSLVALEALGGRKGAVVMSDPRTGEILVLVSSPSFDPKVISEALGAPDLPLFNRAISGAFAPGSTFKMVTTAAAIESGKVDKNFTFKDEGIIRVGSFSYRNWLYTKNGGTEGVVGFERALARSTDTFFYKVGELTGPDTIAEWARRFGYESISGIDLPGEVGGLVPDPDWKEREKKEKWFLGNTYQMAIGQSDILATPLQVNLATGIFATKGKKCLPHLVVDSESRILCQQMNLQDQTWDIIQKGMEQACSVGGTAFPLFDFQPRLACKTGTAEYYDVVSKRIKTHAWLTAYGPVENPQIAITAMVEGGGGGSNVAAPIVRKVLARFYNITDNFDYKAVAAISE